MRRVLAVALWVGMIGAARADEAEAGFKPIFDGKTTTGWKFYFGPKATAADIAKAYDIKDGVIQSHGKPTGYIYTEESFTNYIIRYDWMYPKEQPKGTTMNTGLLVHIQSPPAVWPKSVEPQGRLKDHGKLFFVGGLKPIGTPKFDDKALASAVKPQGEWNTTEVVCDADGSITVKVNGVEISSGKTALTSGPIGLQSEGAEVHFKNIRVNKR